jgi:hypothetical protein
MLKSGGGFIVNTSSIIGIVGQPVIGAFVHAATKLEENIL